MPDQRIDIENMTVEDLRARAKERGFRGYSSMRKDELVEALTGSSGSAGGNPARQRQQQRGTTSGADSSEQVDPVELLKSDHDVVRRLFEEFESASSGRDIERIVREALLELDVHAAIEEEIYYPAVAEALGPDDEETVHEAEEEHHVVHVLIEELRSMGSDDERFKPKFTVLMENVRHHMDEEEQEMLPEAEEALGEERSFELGAQMARRKRELAAELRSSSQAS